MQLQITPGSTNYYLALRGQEHLDSSIIDLLPLGNFQIGHVLLHSTQRNLPLMSLRRNVVRRRAMNVPYNDFTEMRIAIPLNRVDKTCLWWQL